MMSLSSSLSLSLSLSLSPSLSLSFSLSVSLSFSLSFSLSSSLSSLSLLLSLPSATVHDTSSSFSWYVVRRHERTHELPIGEFWYKFVVDGKKWTHSLDHPIVVDGEHVNNFVNIRGGNSGSDQLRRELEAGTELTKEQKRVIRETLR